MPLKKATQINPHKFPLITLHQFIFRSYVNVATYARAALSTTSARITYFKQKGEIGR